MPYQADSEFADFVQSLPKTETHLHIEGACPIELLREANPEKAAGPFPFHADDFRYESFLQFMEMFRDYAAAVYTSAENYRRASAIVLGKCAAQNVKYVETSFHIGALEFMSDTGQDVVDAIHEGAPDGLEVRVFMGVCHDDYVGLKKEAIDDCVNWKGFAGIDLHGPEDLPVEPWTAEAWQRVRDAGMFTKAHAGEFMGADFVELVLNDLKVTRIEHGVRSVERDDIVDRLVRENIALDVCPISNVKLAVQGVTSMAAHPIRQLFDRGVTVTINSDDPFFFGNTLSEEYYALHQDLDFTRKEIIQIARNGFQIARWDDASKLPHLDRLAAIESSLA